MALAVAAIHKMEIALGHATAASPLGAPPRWRWTRWAAPRLFYALAGRVLPWLWGAAALAGTAALVLGLAVLSDDSQQGDAWRIVFLHVPAAWMSMLLYLAMAFWCGIGLVFHTRLAAMLARAIAPTGALMTFLALWTGSLWGKPTWGTWWVWDARLTSEMLLLFLYLGFIALQASTDDPRRGDRAGAVLALVGAVNVPVIYFSVVWWNTLHQGPTIRLAGESAMAPTLLATLLLAAAACWGWCSAATLHRVRSIILEREADASWIAEVR